MYIIERGCTVVQQLIKDTYLNQSRQIEKSILRVSYYRVLSGWGFRGATRISEEGWCIESKGWEWESIGSHGPRRATSTWDYIITTSASTQPTMCWLVHRGNTSVLNTKDIYRIMAAYVNRRTKNMTTKATVTMKTLVIVRHVVPILLPR